MREREVRRPEGRVRVNYKLLETRRLPDYGPKVKGLSGLVILHLATTSCMADVRSTPTPEIFPTQPRIATVTPSRTPEPETREPKTWPGVSYDRQRILAYGRSIGAGGPGKIEPPVYINNMLINSFVGAGLRPIVDGANGNLFTQVLVQDGSRTCFPNIPEVLYNPNVPSGQDDSVLDANNIRYYGDAPTKTIRYQAVVPASLNPLAEDVVCGSAVAMLEKANIFGAKPGTVFNVLYNRKNGEIYGAYRSVFSRDDGVIFDQKTGILYVNGRSVWFEGPNMAKLEKQLTPAVKPSSTPEPSATPVYESLWDPARIRWRHEAEGQYENTKAKVSIEIDASLYERKINALKGFTEGGGTWEDVGKTIAAGVSFLPSASGGKKWVDINMDLHPDGSWDYVKFFPEGGSGNTKVQFDPKVPIRFIYWNGDGGANGRVFPLKNPDFSRGWGVDPKNKGLVIFIGETTHGDPVWYDYKIYESLEIITHSGFVTTVYNQEHYDTLFNLWYGDHKPFTLAPIR